MSIAFHRILASYWRKKLLPSEKDRKLFNNQFVRSGAVRCSQVRSSSVRCGLVRRGARVK